MIPLEMAQDVLMWLSLYTPDDSISERRKTINKVSSVIIVILIFCGSITGCIFFLKHMINDLGMAVNALWLTTSVSYGLYMYIVLFFSRDKMRPMFESLAKIYDASE